MTVTLNTDPASVVAQPGQQIDIASLLTITAGSNPTYLVVSLLDRNEYTATSNGATGTLSGNGQTLGLSNIGGDSDTAGIVFTYNAATGQYTNPIYGNLANLFYIASTNTNDNTSISFFTTNNSTIANEYANNPYALEQNAPTNTTYVGSTSVVTQPSFIGPTPTQATPDSVGATAMSFVGKAWNMDGCWVLACNISAEAGASLPLTSTSLGIPGVANGEWIVAYNGPAGQAGNWEAQITAGEMVVFETSATSGHITTVVSGSGTSAMLVDNITYVNQNGQIVNSANDGSANDIIISTPHLASQEWAMAVPGSVVVYELDCPIINVTTAVSTDAAGKTVALAPLFGASNPLTSQAITEYQFYDVGTGGAASDSFIVGGTDEVGHSAANAITVSASALSTLALLAGSSAGTDTIEVRAFNGSYWGDWASMTVNVTGNATLSVASILAATDNGNLDVNGAHLVTVTMNLSEVVIVTGTPTLQLSDNEVAVYAGGSGTNSLTFAYVVQTGDNTSDLQVTGLNLPSGASIVDSTGNSLASPVTGALGIQVNATAAASVLQEVNGLYVALYGVAATGPGAAFWVNQVLAHDSSETLVSADSTAPIPLPDAQFLGQQFVETQATYFQSQYGSLTDAQFVQALYSNLGGSGISNTSALNYWLGQLQAAEVTLGDANNGLLARASVVGQFAHDLVSNDLYPFGSNAAENAAHFGLSAADYAAVVADQQSFLDKIAVSQAYAQNATATGSGSILNYTTESGPAWTAAQTVLAGVTANPATVSTAIVGINNAVAHVELALI